jgi:hypothetical protein
VKLQKPNRESFGPKTKLRAKSRTETMPGLPKRVLVDTNEILAAFGWGLLGIGMMVLLYWLFGGFSS